MSKQKLKVKTIKWKKEKIKYTIVSCTQDVVDKIDDDSWDNILDVTKKVVRKRTSPFVILLFPVIIGFVLYFKDSFTRFRLAQGYNEYSKQLGKNNKKLSTMYILPRLVIGTALQKGIVNANSKKMYVKLALPVE